MDKNLQLIELATRLLALGVKVEQKRGKLRDLVEVQGLPCSSAPVREALSQFQNVDKKWRDLEQQYLELRQQVMKPVCQID